MTCGSGMDPFSNENQEIRFGAAAPRTVSSQASLGGGRALRDTVQQTVMLSDRVVVPCGWTATGNCKPPDDD